ncbi:MAG: arsenite methyltransferase [Bacteroidetes bacterium]|nr:arsenite methyltransferase [Bacteroidota bacterium]MCW5894366.1 arsenite methyltransferase [Bacteroidota bacterium]
MTTQLESETKSCCEPTCCEPESSTASTPVTDEQLKGTIRERYGEIAAKGGSCCAPASGSGPNCGCGTDNSLETVSLLMNDTYTNVDEQIVQAADLGLGCGTPLAFAEMEEGMTVLDLGSGAGIDVFLAAKKVGPTGKAIGLDMTDEMLKLARKNKLKLGIENAHFWKGEIEDMPIESSSIDRILSNCVINLVPDKSKAFAEMYRVLKPGGKFTISDIVSIGEIPAETRRDLELWAGCVSGAVDKEEYLRIVREAGFKNLTIGAEKKYSLNREVPFGLVSITLTAQK